MTIGTQLAIAKRRKRQYRRHRREELPVGLILLHIGLAFAAIVIYLH